MKKLLTLAFLAVLAFNASSQTFEQGKNYLHFGIGIGSAYGVSGAKMGIPPVHASLEHGITEKIGIGGIVGYNSAVWESSILGDKYRWKYSYLLLGARGAYHFTQVTQADIYLGAMLGYNVVSAKFESDNNTIDETLVSSSSASGVAVGGFVGARKKVGEKVTLFGELGYSVAYLSLGICLNL